MIERRKSFRVHPRDDNFRVLCHRTACIGWVADISTVGLSFDYIPVEKDLPKTEQITIFSEGKKSFYLPHVSCKTIYDIRAVDNIGTYNAVMFRRRAVKYVSPTRGQMNRIMQLFHQFEIPHPRLPQKIYKTAATISKRKKLITDRLLAPSNSSKGTAQRIQPGRL